MSFGTKKYKRPIPVLQFHALLAQAEFDTNYHGTPQTHRNTQHSLPIYDPKCRPPFSILQHSSGFALVLKCFLNRVNGSLVFICISRAILLWLAPLHQSPVLRMKHALDAAARIDAHALDAATGIDSYLALVGLQLANKQSSRQVHFIESKQKGLASGTSIKQSTSPPSPALLDSHIFHLIHSQS